MQSPFPGMDPYLESSELWSGFHYSLGAELKARLALWVGPKYYVDADVRSIEGNLELGASKVIRPDVGVFEPFLAPTAPARGGVAVAIPPAPIQRVTEENDEPQLRAVQIFLSETGEPVTSIEILSPYNKRIGVGLDEYRSKRSRMLHARVHLIELDLLRGGMRPGAEVNRSPIEAEYILLVNRFGRERVSEIWPVALNESLPLLPVPLLPPDPDVPLELGAAIRAVYEAGRYGWRIHYQRPVPPPELRPAMEVVHV